MNQELGLRVLSEIMSWDDDLAEKEFNWLRLMARLKYDGYRDFHAGMRFIESLAVWLQQFERNDRETAYAFVRNSLVYIGPGEMQRLVEQFYPRTVWSRLIRMVAADRGIPTYRVLADEEARTQIRRLRRQTLFMGLSDGARMDAFRRINAEILTNEQLVVTTQLDKEKWMDLLITLREDLHDSTARFRLIYLVDDFTGTGSSFLRYNDKKSKWSGKLIRFQESLDSARSELMSDYGDIVTPVWDLCIHHFIASTQAKQGIEDREKRFRDCQDGSGWAHATQFTFGIVLPETVPINASSERDEDFLELTNKYYDEKIQTRHTDVGGVTHMGLGYGGCALPLVLEHNTPNNSVALLWAETGGGVQNGIEMPAMRPLFRRRQRHS